MNINTIFHATASALSKSEGIRFVDACEMLKSKTRTQDLTMHRKAYCAISKKYTRATIKSIGKMINRDHATVLHHRADSHWALKSSDEYNDVFKNVMAEIDYEVHKKSTHFNSRAGLVEFLNEKLNNFQRKRMESYKKYTLRFIDDSLDEMIEIVKQLPKTN